MLSIEQLIKNTNLYSKTKFACIRPGNYFESNGNVFELWEKQALTGTCTLTDEGMYRYFIRLADAARIAIDCLFDMKGGEIFIPKMKEYSMLELLKERYPGIGIKIIGKRDGERLHEPLFTEDEKLEDCGEYYVVK